MSIDVSQVLRKNEELIAQNILLKSDQDKLILEFRRLNAECDDAKSFLERVRRRNDEYEADSRIWRAVANRLHDLLEYPSLMEAWCLAGRYCRGELTIPWIEGSPSTGACGHDGPVIVSAGSFDYVRGWFWCHDELFVLVYNNEYKATAIPIMNIRRYFLV